MQQMVLALFLAVGAVLLQVSPAVGGRWPDSCGDHKVHNFEYGKLNHGDRILNSSFVIEPKKMLRVLSFDKQFQTRSPISFIQILDQKRDGKGGCVYLNGGGVGYPNVNLHFKSARGEGINFLVNIYGR